MIVEPLVDVAMVTYNHGKYIASAIESVLEQRTAFPVRIVIGDDCSTDGTQSVIEQYRNKYPDRITALLFDQHIGLVRNCERVGFKVRSHCTAQYIAWLDGDDSWTSPDKLQKQVDCLETNPEYSICFHNVRAVYEETGETYSWCPPNQKELSTMEDLLVRNFIPSCSVMCRRRLYENLPDWCGSFFLVDWMLHLTAATKGPIFYLNKVMADYRVHSGGAWSSMSRIEQVEESIRMLTRLDAHFGSQYSDLLQQLEAGRYVELASYLEFCSDMKNARRYALKGLRRRLRNRQSPGWPLSKILCRLFCPPAYAVAKSVWGRTTGAVPRK